MIRFLLIAVFMSAAMQPAAAARRTFFCKKWEYVQARDFGSNRVRVVPICDTRVR